MKKRWFQIFICLSFVGILIISYQQWIKLNPENTPLTKQEATILVEERYQGTVTAIIFTQGQFQIELEKDYHHYNIRLDAKSGHVQSFSRLKVSSQQLAKQLTEDENEVNANSSRLDEAEAIKLALEQVKGTVDKIELVTTNDQTYYLVEIKTEDRREAFVQIHAITSEIMSVSWDDHSEDEIENESNHK